MTNTVGIESTTTFDADKHGYQALIDTLTTTGNILAVGVEGTNSYGAGLTRALVNAGYTVTEVLRPTRQVRRLTANPILSTPSPPLVRCWPVMASRTPRTPRHRPRR